MFDPSPSGLCGFGRIATWLGPERVAAERDHYMTGSPWPCLCQVLCSAGWMHRVTGDRWHTYCSPPSAPFVSPRRLYLIPARLLGMPMGQFPPQEDHPLALVNGPEESCGGHTASHCQPPRGMQSIWRYLVDSVPLLWDCPKA